MKQSINTPMPSQPQIEVLNGQLFTSSLDVARHFGKRHNNVIRAIKNLEIPNDFRLLNFEECEIIRDIPLQGEKAMPAYNITRDGFVILVMGFTGKEAMAWKLKYLEAFNQMETYIKGQSAKGQLPLFTPSPLEVALTNSQRKYLDLLVSTWSACSRIGTPRAWQKIHKHFGTKSIADFKLLQLTEIIQWIQERINIAIATGGLDCLDTTIFDPRCLLVYPTNRKYMD